MKTLILLSTLLFSLSSFAQMEIGYRQEVSASDPKGAADSRLILGGYAEEEDIMGSARLILPLSEKLSEQDDKPKYVFGIEMQALYKLHERVGVGMMGEITLDSWSGTGSFGPATRVNVINNSRFQAGLEGRYDMIHKRYQIGSTLVLGRSSSDQ